MPIQRQRLTVAAAICAAAVFSTPAPLVARPGGRATVASSVAGNVIDLTNVERTRQHRSALHANPRLMRAAQIQAEQMARARRLAHVLPNATYPSAKDRLAAADYRWQTYGENVALGQSDARDAVRSWMHSRGHRTNILNADFSEMGAGYATDAAGRPYYVQVFGRPLS
ncbi:MAG TPA: CAP domain-containing protein [Vicinamibacterales bacterium]|nr:CAP domain-containing protein [Vicinamibacterales bacterium]